MKKKPLTDKEQKFWESYYEYFLDLLKEPTREELARHLNLSPQLCQYYLNILRKKGYIKGRSSKTKKSKK